MPATAPSQAEFQGHTQARLRLLDSLPRSSVALVPAAVHQLRNGDVHWAFRQSSDYLYLTGLEEADGLLVLAVDSAGAQTQRLYVLDRDPAREQWDGFRLGQDGAAAATGIDDARLLSALQTEAADLIPFGAAVYASSGTPGARARLQRMLGSALPDEPLDLDPLLHAQRQIKQPWELDLMRTSAQIAARAHLRAMQAVQPGMHEYQLEAEYLHHFARSGAREPAYPAIVGGGNNACILHYNQNSAPLHDGDLVLVDAGCEYRGYASDITRTFPVGGKFSPRQRDIYELVLEAQLAALPLVAPGHRYQESQDAAAKVMTRGLMDLGLIRGASLEQALERKLYQPFYMHRLGHWLGLDVHDCGAYQDEDGESIPLREGMVMTVEPGCYILRGQQGVDPEWHGIGVRIEDDVLVTAAGNEVLTDGVPKTAAEVERACAGKLAA